MITKTTIPDLRQALSRLPSPLGLVPTMGGLHEGHLSLVRAAKTECVSVVVSIFVNPTQFGRNEDMETYPRDLPRDLGLLQSEGVDLVWTPTVEIMYPAGFQSWVSVEEITRPLEGALRPDHFRGVTTVVAKLFNSVQPQKAYFGQKDAQQTAVIRQMTRDLDFPIDIVVCPTVREPDGLAMSSRNAYLEPQERQAANVIYHALSKAQDFFHAGELDAGRLRVIVVDTISTEPLAHLQYVSCADPHNLQEQQGAIQDGALLSAAVLFGKTRLIDNIIIG